MEKVVVYSDDYVEKLFQYWYSHGSPTARSMQQMIKEDESLLDEHGRCPSYDTIQNWFIEKGFYARKDLLDARVSTQVDNDLVALKVNMLREQAALFRQVRQKAAQHLLETDFDSSSAAVNAFIRASQEERISLGLSNTIQKISGMGDEELIGKIKELAAKISGDVLDADAVDSEDEFPDGQ